MPYQEVVIIPLWPLVTEEVEYTAGQIGHRSKKLCSCDFSSCSYYYNVVLCKNCTLVVQIDREWVLVYLTKCMVGHTTVSLLLQKHSFIDQPLDMPPSLSSGQPINLQLRQSILICSVFV